LLIFLANITTTGIVIFLHYFAIGVLKLSSGVLDLG